MENKTKKALGVWKEVASVLSCLENRGQVNNVVYLGVLASLGHPVPGEVGNRTYPRPYTTPGFMQVISRA